MDFKVFVGNYCDPVRLAMFLKSITKTINYDTDLSSNDVIVINSSSSNRTLDFVANQHSVKIISFNRMDPAQPAHQMKMRFEIMERVCLDDTIVCNFDDDYQFNPYWLKVADRIISSNESIKYLTMIKLIPNTGLVSGDYIGERFKSGGFNLAWVKSAMGGSFITRWNVFKYHMKAFFDRYDLMGQYDGDFWNVVNEYLGGTHNVCMTTDFSLYQHCNLISQYGHHFPHTYGDGFDPIINPLTLVERGLL